MCELYFSMPWDQTNKTSVKIRQLINDAIEECDLEGFYESPRGSYHITLYPKIHGTPTQLQHSTHTLNYMFKDIRSQMPNRHGGIIKLELAKYLTILQGPGGDYLVAKLKSRRPMNQFSHSIEPRCDLYQTRKPNNYSYHVTLRVRRATLSSAEVDAENDRLREYEVDWEGTKFEASDISMINSQLTRPRLYKL